MKRTLCLLCLVLTLSAPALPPMAGQGIPGTVRFQLVEATIAEAQKAIQTRLITTEELVQMYLYRIAAYDEGAPSLNAFIHLNANALNTARQMDAQRGRGHAKGELTGIPIILKDNVDTFDMPTTAGSVALVGSIPRDDAFIARKLRAAGAIVLGKATLTEFANFLTNGMPAGYSSHGGYGFNPYDPAPQPGGDGRPALSPGGSSSGTGIAVAANLAMVGIGTETSGSILSPGTSNLVVGIKPTVGLVSRDGIIPITADQDTAGPLARTVTDAAIMLGVIAGYDPADAATAACLAPGNCFSDYTRFLNANALADARIAVPPFPDNRADIMNAAIAVLRSRGAYVEIIPALASQLGGCSTAYPPVANCSTVLLYGFKRDLNAYLASLPPSAPVHTLADVIAFNNAHAPASVKYGQVLAVAAQNYNVSTNPPSADTLRYLSDRAEDIQRSRGALDGVYNGPDGKRGTDDDFDALLFSGNSGAGTPAKAGYPSIVVPGGFVPSTDAARQPAPAGVTFSGPAFSESRLIALSYAFEQATKHRKPPASVPPLPTDSAHRP
jgi:amidase